MCVQYYEIILKYSVTFIGNNLILVSLRNNNFLICLIHFAKLIHCYLF
jgi:hypothetical protein